MRKPSRSEKLFLEEMALAGIKLQRIAKGLTIGEHITIIRSQMRMSQGVLADRSGVPQSTISRIEMGKFEPSHKMIKKLLDALSCDLVVVPILRDSIDALLETQAKKIALNQINYLKGTMNLENQEPDSRFFEGLIKEEVSKLLHSSGKKLWG